MRPKFTALSLVLLCILFFASAWAPPASLAQANLELDGNAFDDSGAGIPEDWDLVVTGAGTAVSQGLIADPSPQTIFTTSDSKNTSDISSWRWVDGVVPSKDDMTDAFFAVYEDGEFYFGLDRKGNAGNVHVGFWLLQNDISLYPDGTFSDTHVIGDILVLASFPLGAPTALVPKVYEWDPSHPSAVGNLVEISGLVMSEAYAITNANAECSPWPYTPSLGVACPLPCTGGPCFPPSSFVEGFVDLGTLDVLRCFRTFIAQTQTSPLPSAQLKDFVITSMNISPNVVINDVCAGEDLCAVASGASGSYSYSWSSGETTSCIPAPDPGPYTVTVTDNESGCTGSANGIVIAGPLVKIDPVCEGSQICATVGGGAPPYTFTWSSGYTTQCIANPATGIHFLTVTDANGCTAAATGRVLPGTICPELCVEFTAVATVVDDFYGLLAPSGLAVGDTATGQYVYNPVTPDSNVLPTVGDYEHTNAPYGIEVNVAGMTFETDPASVDFLLEMVNDHGALPRDNYLLRSYINLPVPGGPAVDHIAWQLDDPTALAISSTVAPTSPPNLPDWQSIFGLTIEGANPSNADETYLLQFLVIQDGYCGPTVGIEPGPTEQPSRLALLPAYPNPFVTRTRISFTLVEEAPVLLNLVAVNGRLVRSLYQGNLNAGAWSFPWDGRDDQGRRVPAGVYLVHLVAGDQRQSGRIIRID